MLNEALCMPNSQQSMHASAIICVVFACCMQSAADTLEWPPSAKLSLSDNRVANLSCLKILSWTTFCFAALMLSQFYEFYDFLYHQSPYQYGFVETDQTIPVVATVLTRDTALVTNEVDFSQFAVTAHTALQLQSSVTVSTAFIASAGAASCSMPYSTWIWPLPCKSPDHVPTWQLHAKFLKLFKSWDKSETPSLS